MNNRIADYTFTVIEDGQVPLAGDFGSSTYFPVILVVAAALLVLAAAAYVVWTYTHLKRVEVLAGKKESFAAWIFHPVNLLRSESELEYELVSDISQNIA